MGGFLGVACGAGFRLLFFAAIYVGDQFDTFELSFNSTFITLGGFWMLTTIFVVLYAQSKALIPYLIEEYEERINEPQYTVNENIPLSITISGRKDE